MQLSPTLSDHAVIQRYQSIPVWGWTNKPCTRIRASLGESQAEGISGNDARFLLRLPGMDAGGPHTLTVETLDGEERIVIKDILIGEVWLASGQSNMEWSMAASEYSEEISQSNSQQIRMFTATRRADLAPQSTVIGTWKLSTPETTGDFSAVATFFGNRLLSELHIPVGIIHSSWGGSFIETWISRERLLRTPETREWMHEYDAHAHHSDAWQNTREKMFPSDPGNEGSTKGWHLAEFDDSAWDTMPLPGTWQSRGHNYSAVMWFRKKVTLPAHMRGKKLMLQLGAIDKHDITYANGQETGRTGEGFDESVFAEKRVYEIPEHLTEEPDLCIAVRVYSFAYGGGITGPENVMRLSVKDDEAGESIALSGEWRYQVEHNFGFVDMAQQGMGHGIHNSPNMLFDNMIKPLLPVGVAGAIWYQGESNAGKPVAYRQLMRDLIEDWRYRFGVGDFPFILVQLANYMEAHDCQPESSWAALREAQCDALQLANTGMAVIIDRGEANDIHPKDKKTVGFRLAQWALAKVYGHNIVPGSPLFQGFRSEGTCIRIFFSNAEAGLALADGTCVRTLFIADTRGQFKPARSAIEGSTLTVWHDDMPCPTAVRYAWADNPEGCNLVNAAGFPASPFRTDR